MRHINTKMTQINFRLSEDLYEDFQKLKGALRIKEDSEAIRFCMIYTIASMDKLDKKQLSEALSIAIGELMFGVKR